MSYEIRCIGMNFIKKEEEYCFVPFTKKNIINLQIHKSGILNFTILQSSNISNVNIYRKNEEKIKIFDNNKEVTIKCVDNEIIKLVLCVANTNNINGSKVILKNITIKHDTDEHIVNNDKNDIFQKNTLTLSHINFIIVTTQWGIKIAESLKNMLEEIGHETIIVNDKINDNILKKNKIKPNEYFIILFSHLVRNMPENNKYIIYQLEQKKQSKFVNEKVLNNISNSLLTWDYSNENIAQFDDTYKKKIFYQPISIINKIENSSFPIIYDILFYGTGSIRRNKILKYLKKQNYNIFITAKIFGDEMYKIIAQSKIIINIHVYEDAILEIARINEVLPFNKIIISELPCESDHINKNFYQDKIIFCEIIKRNLSNIKNLTNLIDYYLKPENYSKFIVNNEINISKIYSYSFEHLKKNIILIQDQINKNIILNNNEKTRVINTVTEKENLGYETEKEKLEYETEKTAIEKDDFFITNECKLYLPKSQVMKYFNKTDTIWGKNSAHIVNNVLKNPNHFDVDTFFYSKTNNFKKNSGENIFKNIKNYGIEKGLIYHPKQLKNIFPNINILITNKNKLYIKHNAKYIKAHTFIKNELYKKDFDWYINQIEVMHNNLINNSLLLLVFVGDETVGELLLNKINNYKKIQTFSIGVSFRNTTLYNKFHDFITTNFFYSAIFISKEYGNDILPTLQMYFKINSLIKFDKIMKLHTKSSDINWFNDLTNFLLNVPIFELVNKKTLKSNCVGDIDYYAKDKNPNINAEILNKYKNYIEDKYFIRGSMFYCDKNVFSKIMELIKKDYKLYFNNNLYDTNNINFTNSPVHALERLFGIIKI